MENRALTVSVFNNYIANIIASEEMLVDVSIIGEICDFTVNRGIAYFSIKDQNAILSCLCFFEPTYQKMQNGMQMIVTGSPQFYAKGGRFNFKVSSAVEVGAGKEFLKFLELKQKLEKLGYFDESIKKHIPAFSQKIGVLTSKTGAVLRDINSVAKRRNPFYKLFLCDCSVQGALAESEIVDGLKVLDDLGLDVIIIARGGGSGEDLSVFNSEKIAKAVFEAKTPIISAIGHQTDFCICDFVADVRAATPSVAAELAIWDFASLFERFKNAFYMQCQTNKQVLEGKIAKCHQYYSKLNFSLEQKLLTNQSKLEIFGEKLDGNNPFKILQKGYSVVTKNGIVAKDLKVDDVVTIKTSQQKLLAKIVEVEEK